MTDTKTSTNVALEGIGAVGRVWLAPMTGVSDLPFRQLACRLGATYVATEMVACEQLALERPEMVRRASIGSGLPIMVVQLVGGDPSNVAAGAVAAARAGAQIIDLNLGCPAKSVTGIACGSALMRVPDLALALVSAVAGAVSVPVTVKMRLGWDDHSRNAPELATALEAVGAKAITVHGRTRAQFYSGKADWRAVAAVKQAVKVPVIVNGDIVDTATARQALADSRADAVMIGRGAIGRPWLAALIEAELRGGRYNEPDPAERVDLVMDHRDASLAFYGRELGDRMFRKHLAAYIDAAPWAEIPVRQARAALCQLTNSGEVRESLERLWGAGKMRLAA